MSNKDPEIYKTYMRAYMLRRYRQRREESIRKLGGVCLKCGTKKRLELDHKDPKTKSFAISKMWSVAKDRYLAELSKCQLLCQPCHVEKTLRESGKKRAKGRHGTLSSYRYCKCSKCRAAKATYSREYKRRHRVVS